MVTNAVRLIVPVLLGALMLLFPSDGLRALGLGEARVDSWLGQPLDASIRLLAAEDENVESLSVRPAELADFERLGVPSESLGLGLEVTVDRSVEPARVRVRSRQPVNDPVVQILIDARWSSGRVLREYTLFLDPPTVDSTPPVRRVEREQAAQAEPSEPSTREETPARTQPVEPARTPSQPAEQAAQTTQPEAAQPEPEAAPDRMAAETVAVAPGDTLWRIATEWRPDSSLSMDQVMLAIFNRNRDAFLGENINRLRSDARLNMPALEDVRTVDRTEAERRVRDHMNAWQAGTPAETPEVSEAAMPEAEPTRATESTPASAEEETAHRLDVVPLDDEPSDEGAAVSDGEIRRVRGELTQVEDEILAEGLERQEFDDRIAEIRDALDQSDLAGLAVAEESLAELQERLREVREAEAAQADVLADGRDNETGQGDRVADYMRELDGEFAGDASASNVSDEPPAAVEEVAAETETTQDSARNEEPASEAPAEDNLPGWWMPAAGLLLLALILAAVVFWLLRRRSAGGASQAAEPKAGAVKTARSRVERHPSDLAAHLALLQVLADRGHTEEFTDAFDEMYQQVDDESDPNWQEAVSLAAAHAPDHPLLTPRETSLEDDHERRTDEMLGMLEADSETEFGEEAEADQAASSADEAFDPGGEDEEDEAEAEAEVERPSAQAADAGEDEGDPLGEDMDLAVLSERVDDPSVAPGQDRSFDHDEDELDFGGFAEEDEWAVGEEAAGSPAEASNESSVALPDETAAESDLDLGSARDQEADEIVGESGTREEEDFDLEFTSDLEHEAGLDTEGGLEFDFEETSETPETPEAAEAAEAAETAETATEEESEAAEADVEAEAEAEDEAEAETAEPEASDDQSSSLSDEDADVKLDLARAYISVDLGDSARSVLEEVISEGSPGKRAEAKKLLDDLE